MKSFKNDPFWFRQIRLLTWMNWKFLFLFLNCLAFECPQNYLITIKHVSTFNAWVLWLPKSCCNLTFMSKVTKTSPCVCVCVCVSERERERESVWMYDLNMSTWNDFQFVLDIVLHWKQKIAFSMCELK